MKRILRENKGFWICMVAILLPGITMSFVFEQADMVLWLNRQRTDVLDRVFIALTRAGEGYAYLIALLVYLMVDRKKMGWIGLAGILVLIVSHALKTWFGNARPAMFFKKAGLLEQVTFIDGVDVLWGNTSFPSGHTMSAFALCTLISLWSAEKKWLPALLCLLALCTGISRVYLLAHFQQDVMSGSLIGIAIGLLVYTAFGWYNRRNSLVGPSL